MIAIGWEDGTMGRLDGRSCLIVGGTGGIGLATVRRFVEEGARVVAAGHPDQAGALAESGLIESGQAVEYVVDVADESAVSALFDFAHQSLGGRMDVLLHVSGISGRRFGDAELHLCTTTGWDRVMEINARGTFLTNRRAVQLMLQQGRDRTGLRGVILNVGSVLDRSPAPRHFSTLAYAASKAAVRAMTLASAAKYAGEGIRFGLIEPALLDTPMAARALGDEALQPYLRSKMPLTQGAIQPEAVADAAVFLASSEARTLTGTVLTVDGGWCISEGQTLEPG